MATDDMALVREYARGNSEAAFATLVSRHVNLVYSVALRQVRDPHLAAEVTQSVFILLARKAGSLGADTILPGWLCRTARFASADTLKIQRRRQLREQEAHMQSILNEPDSDPAAWQQIAPLLDEALGTLGEKDHDAVVLRYFNARDLKAIGAAMGLTEDAARMRVNRGLEKLRQFFTKKGVTLSVVAIAGAVSANAVQAAPAALAVSVTTATLSGAAAPATATLAAGKAAGATTFKKIVVAALAILIAGAGIHTLHQGIVGRPPAQRPQSRSSLPADSTNVATAQGATSTEAGDKLSARAILDASRKTYSSLSTYRDTGWTAWSPNDKHHASTNTFTELLGTRMRYRIEIVTSPFSETNRFWSDGLWNWAQEGGGLENGVRHLDLKPCLMITALETGIPAMYFGISSLNPFHLSPFPRLDGARENELIRKLDEKVGDTECYVITRIIRNPAIIWIGKQDFLIRRYQQGYPDALRIETHENIRTNENLQAADYLPAGVKLTRAAEPAELSAQGILEATRRAYASLSTYRDTGWCVHGDRTNTFTELLGTRTLHLVEIIKGDEPYATERHWCDAPGLNDASDDLTGLLLVSRDTGIPAIYFSISWGHPLLSFGTELVHKPDERVGDTDCYVVAGTSAAKSPVTLWVGKGDFLIRRYQGQFHVETHENIRTNEVLKAADFSPTGVRGGKADVSDTWR